MERIEPTRKIALRIWWAVVWRYLIGLVLIGLAQAMLLVVLAAMFRMSSGQAEAWSGVLFLFVGLPLIFLVSWELVYRVLRKRFVDFELVLIRRDPDREDSDPPVEI